MISILLQNGPADGSRELLDVLVKCCGEEFYNHLEQYVLHLESLKKKVADSQGENSQEVEEILSNYPELDQKIAAFGKVLEGNILYRLVEVSSFSKMSVISALRNGKRSAKIRALEILESTSSSTPKQIERELLEILDAEDDPNVVEKILGFSFLSSGSSSKDSNSTKVLFKKFVQLKRKELCSKIKNLASKNKNSTLSGLIAFYESLLNSEISIPESKSSSLDELNTCLETIHQHTDQLSQGSFTAALLSHLTKNMKDIDGLRTHKMILEFMNSNKISAFFSSTHQTDLVQIFNKQLNSDLALDSTIKMLEILALYKNLYSLSAT